jgi:hypothetical protein
MSTNRRGGKGVVQIYETTLPSDLARLGAGGQARSIFSRKDEKFTQRRKKKIRLRSPARLGAFA